ncbi:MAG TPA: substrate-binding domain-containing protein [Solirubrobacterales bacterium]
MNGLKEIAARRRWIAAALALCLAALALSACGGSSSSSSSSESSTGSEETTGGEESAGNEGGSGGSSVEGKTVVFVPGVSPLPYFDTMNEVAEEEAKKYGLNYTYQPPPEFNPEVETETLNAVLATEPDLLIVSPVDPVALRPPIERFIAKGIPVITIDGELENREGIVTSIYCNNREGGQLAGEALGKLMGGTGSTAIFNIAPGIPNLEERIEGFEEALSKNYPKVTVAAVENPGADPSDSQTKARSVLLANPDIRGFFGTTEVNAEGAAAAVKALGKSNEILTAAYDTAPNEVELLKEGVLAVLIAQEPIKEIQEGMKAAVETLEGNESEVPETIVLKNKAITAENVDDPSNAPYLYQEAR